ncbi:argininosuccinate synthase-related protein [Rhizorhapis suberifaciens]|uniref:argininosuccinate synthase n=1 Tax=Rhizorhapis suberifaciens TaxID=13656 RepID=A0A840HXX9_9SPHN|nr:argininosuccinate synthase-related protein [Rhizorhapis suberifaciens]MBB4642965.1 argininosuccinate synthase [Rhizorhapis suberifaciens]
MHKINSFEDIFSRYEKSSPVVTMFSGGLDSTYLLFKLHEAGYTNVHAVAVDVGDPVDEEALRQMAGLFKAQLVLLDGKETFVENAVRPAIRAHAKYLGVYPVSSSLSRPVIATLVANYAVQIGAGLLLHTANLSQNSLPRLNNAIARHHYDGFYGSPYVGSALSRVQKAAELAPFGLTFVTDRQLSGDANLWCREFESGPLDDPEGFEASDDTYLWTRRSTGILPTRMELHFEAGELVAVDKLDMELLEIIHYLNHCVGCYGHGRYVGLEHISTGEKVLEVREAPAATIIMDALRHLEVASLDTNALVAKQRLEQDWVQEAVAGRWDSTVHRMTSAAIKNSLSAVSGSVKYLIDERRFTPTSIIADKPLYIRDRDLWEFNRSQELMGGNRNMATL